MIGQRWGEQRYGCLVDGLWGQYAIGKMLRLAEAWGWTDVDAIGVDFDAAPDDLELFVDLADSAEAWMNEHLAIDGAAFGWYEGEFYYWSDEDWQQVA